MPVGVVGAVTVAVTVVVTVGFTPVDWAEIRLATAKTAATEK